jgi:hypothetical protein
MIRTTIVIAWALAFAAMLPVTPALAQRDRVFVASYGSDSNPCTFGSPCKTFQQAVNVVAQGGEVTAIDSAGFGTITIQHSVTITSPNGVEAGIAAPASGAAAITINAGSGDIVRLNGLTLDGDAVANSTGIKFNSGGSLEIQNSVIRNFANEGIAFFPDSSTLSSLSVSDTLSSDNSIGISVIPAGSGTTNGVLDHVRMENNSYAGVNIYTTTQFTNVTVSDSVISNGGYGIFSNSNGVTPVNVMVRSVTIANNVGYGLVGQYGDNTIWVTRSTITGNGTGWSANMGASVLSFGDNNIIGNAGGNSTPSSVAYK